MAHLRRQVVSRRTVFRGAVGAAAGRLLPGSGRWSGQAVAASTGHRRGATTTASSRSSHSAAHGQTTTMVLPFINEQGRELDRVVFSRTAGG
jgi:hypothetical protein